MEMREDTKRVAAAFNDYQQAMDWAKGAMASAQYADRNHAQEEAQAKRQMANAKYLLHTFLETLHKELKL